MGDYLRELFEKEEYERNKDKYDLFEKNFENILNDFIPQDREDQFKLRIFSGIDNYWFSENINFRTEQLFKLYFVYMLATTKKRVGLNINHVRTFIADLPGADKILRLSNEELGNSILALSNVSYIKYDGSIVLRNGNSLEMLSELKAKHNIKINNFYKKGISLVAKSIIKANQKKLFIQSGISINNASDKLMGQYILLNNELQNSFSKWNDFEDFEPVLKTLRKNGWNNSAIGALIKDRVAFKIFYEAKEVIDFLMFSYPSFAKENNIELLIVSISTNRDVPFEPILTENVYEQIKNTIRTPYPNSNSVAILQLESTPTADYNFEEIKHFNEVDVLNNQEGFQVDIAVVAALKKELQPLLDIKDIKWDKEPKGKEFNTYYKGTFIKGGSEVSIVATYCPQMGMAASTLVSMDMINKFRPKYLAMIGIAAGVSGGEIKLGDILVAETSFDYGSGKVVTNDDGTSSFLAHYKQIPIDLDILGSLDSDHEQILKNIYISYMDMDKGELPPQLPKMRIGPVASGAMVVAHEDIIKEIKSHERKLIGIDMETYGVYFAARYAPKQIKPTFFSIKAVCDFADEKKGDKFHSYACFVSANFLFQFFLNEEI